MSTRSHVTRIPSVSSTASTTIVDGNHPISSRHLPPAPSTVRRNLFHSHLGRRQQHPATAAAAPAATASAPAYTRTQARGLSGSGDGSALSCALNEGIMKSRMMSGMVPMNVSSDAGDIVARDQNGSYKVDLPILRPGSLEDGNDDAMMDIVEGGGHIRYDHEGRISDMDKAKMDASIDASIADLMRRNRNRQMNCEPEVYLVVRQSLQSRVEQLEEDNWMFEGRSRCYR